MTEVAFHFGATDRLRYACRLLRKISGAGKTALVWAEPQTLPMLAQGVWSVGPTDFVPHASDASSSEVMQRSDILLTADLRTHAEIQRDVLVNLHPSLPPGYHRFGRVIEIVSADGDDRESARGKWRQYTVDGHSIVRHDLKLKEGSA